MTVAWRAPGELQLVDPAAPGRSVVLCGVGLPAQQLLTLLDGSNALASVVAEAGRQGMSESDALEIIRELAAAGFVTDHHTHAPSRPAVGLEGSEASRWLPEMSALTAQGSPGAQTLAVRAETAVAVYGVRSVGPLAAAILAAAGVGRVVLSGSGRVRAADCLPGGVTPDEVGTPRTAAARAAVHRSAPGASVQSVPGRGGVRCAVFADGIPSHHPSLRTVREAGVPHLSCRASGATGQVGPFVVPGQGPCLDCLRRHRTDLDPAWPLLEAQAALADREPAGSATSLAIAVAALAAGQVLALVDGRTPDTIGAVWELREGSVRTRRQLWSRHPDCPCAAAAAR